MNKALTLLATSIFLLTFIACGGDSAKKETSLSTPPAIDGLKPPMPE